MKKKVKPASSQLIPVSVIYTSGRGEDCESMSVFTKDTGHNAVSLTRGPVLERLGNLLSPQRYFYRVNLKLKADRCIRLKLLVWRKPLLILSHKSIKQLCYHKVWDLLRPSECENISRVLRVTGPRAPIRTARSSLRHTKLPELDFVGNSKSWKCLFLVRFLSEYRRVSVECGKRTKSPPVCRSTV